MSTLKQSVFGLTVFLMLVVITGPSAMADTWARPASDSRVLPARSASGVKVFRATWQKQSKTWQAAPNHEWRKTRLGWQQIRVRPDSHIHPVNPPGYRPAFHPILVSALILLLSLVALSWASDEWNWNRLVSGRQRDASAQPVSVHQG